MQHEYLSMEGPVECRNGRLVLRIPLAAGGDRLRTTARAISFEENGQLVVELPDWLAQRMRLREGTPVHIDDRWGKLNIARLR